MAKVKVCGITNLEDALLACDLGADALGFVFYEKSPRYIHPAEAKEIVLALPPFITTVGVFVNKPLSQLHDICKNVPLSMVQLHGDEKPEYCRRVSLPCLKAFRVREKVNLPELRAYQTAGFLLDTLSDDGYGGTGETFDWNIAREVKKFGRVVLSGGLTPDNIFDALTFVQPYAVDVNSGVESFPGKKDPHKLKKFFEEVRKHESRVI